MLERETFHHRIIEFISLGLGMPDDVRAEIIEENEDLKSRNEVLLNVCILKFLISEKICITELSSDKMNEFIEKDFIYDRMISKAAFNLIFKGCRIVPA